MSNERLFRYTQRDALKEAVRGTYKDMPLKRQSEAAAAAVDGGIENAATMRGGSTKCAV